MSEVTGVVHYQEWYPGRPVLVTANDHVLGVYNGDIGVTVLRPDGRLAVALAATARIRDARHHASAGGRRRCTR